MLLHQRLQALAQLLHLRLQALDDFQLRPASPLAPAVEGIAGLIHLIFQKEDQGHLAAVRPPIAPLGAEPDRHADAVGVPVEAHRHRLGDYVLPLVKGLEKRHAQIEEQLRAHQVEQVVRDRSARVLEVAPRRLGQVEDAVRLVHQHAGRAFRFQRHAVKVRGRQSALGRRVAVLGVERATGGEWGAAHAQGHRWDRGVLTRPGAFLVEAVLFVQRAEKMRGHVCRFRAAQKKKAARVQRVVENLVDIFLQRALQVDEQVAAGDQVHTGKRGIAQHAVAGEEHHIAQFAPDAVVVPLFREKALEPLLRHIRLNGGGVNPLARPCERPVVQVGGKHLKVKLVQGHFMARGLLHQQHRHRIGFLAGRAADGPDAHAIALAAPLEEGGDRLLGQRLPGAAIAEKVGNADEQVVEERVGLVWLVAQKEQVGFHAFLAAKLHPAADAAQHGRALVLGKVVPRVRVDLRQDALEVLHLAHGKLRHVGGELDPVPLVRDQVRRQLAHRHHQVSQAGGDGGAWHPLVLRLLGVLHQQHPALFLDCLHPHRAIGPATGEDDRHAVAVRHCQAAEKKVDRPAMPARLLEVGGGEVGIGDDDALVGGNQVNVVGRDLHLPHYLCDRHGRVALQNLVQQALARGVQVGDHDESHVRAGGSASKKRCRAASPPAEAPMPTTRMGCAAASTLSLLAMRVLSKGNQTTGIRETDDGLTTENTENTEKRIRRRTTIVTTLLFLCPRSSVNCASPNQKTERSNIYRSIAD